MAIVPIENGKAPDKLGTTSASDKKKEEASRGPSGLDKEAFLQLLVAQMQYQDPLEPMDNTEYVAQLATFSQLEAIQNMTDTVNQGMANELVGKYVIINQENGGSVSGKVDYVMYKDGEVLLAVNDGLYSIDDLYTVADGEYYEAAQMAEMMSGIIARLPDPKKATVADAPSVEKAIAVYQAMNAYQQGFVSKEDLEKLTALELLMKEMTGGNTSGGTAAGADTKTEAAGS